MLDKSYFEFAKNLELGIKSLQMYSEAHPRTQSVLQETYQSFVRLMETHDSVTFSVVHENLIVDGEIVERGNPALIRLARELSSRSVETLKILRSCQQEDLVSFLRQLLLSPQRLREMGGIEKICSDQGIQAIQVNKVKYGIIEDDAFAGLDQAVISELLLAVQALSSSTWDTAEVAQNLEKSLEMKPSIDPGEALLRLFQMVAHRAPDQTAGVETEPLRQNFTQLYHSFSPALQAKILLSSILRESSEKNDGALYRQIAPDELEMSVIRILHEPLPQNILNELAARIQKDDLLSLSDRLMQVLRDKELIQPEVLAPPSIAEELLKKESLTRMDIEKIPEGLHELINKGNLQEADLLSKKLFSCLGAGQPDQKIAVIEFLPAAIRALSRNEKWKNVEFSLSFLISTCYRKETSEEVLRVYIPFLLAIYMRHYEAKNWQGCQDVLSTIRVQTERMDSVKKEFADAWIRIAEAFIEHIREGRTGIESVLEGFKIAGNRGISYLMEMLAHEEDQSVRSRLISFIVSFKPEIVSAELEARMSDPRWFVVRNMVTIVSKSQATELPDFLEAAAVHSDPRVPKELIKILYKGTAKAQLRFILLLLEHPDKAVRIQAVHLVTMHSISGAVPALLKILGSGSVPETDLRTACLQALLKMRSMEGIIPAATLLDRKPSSKAELAERNAAVRLLGELAREQTRTVLERIAQTDPNAETRTLAGSYL